MTIGDVASKDLSGIDICLCDDVLQGSLLALSVAVKLIKVNKTAVGESHVCVVLVDKIDMIEIVHLELFGKEFLDERALSTALITYEHHDELIAIDAFHT